MRARTDWGDLISPDYQRGRDVTFPRPTEPPPSVTENPL